MRLRIVKGLIRLLFRVEIRGKYLGGVKNGCEKTLIIANHTSFLDGLLLALFLPDNPIFVIHRESTRSRFVRWCLKDVKYIMVDSDQPMAIRHVLRELNNGKPVVIFPEGRVTVTGTLMKLYDGAVYAAMKTQATLIPVHIDGTQYSYFSRLSHLLQLRAFPKLTISIFPPTRLNLSDDHVDEDKTLDSSTVTRKRGREQLNHIMQEMMVSVREPTTLFEMLLNSQKLHGSAAPLFADDLGEPMTYGDVVKRSVALSVLMNRKLDLGERVGMMLPATCTGAMAFYACQHAGVTPVMINYTAGSRAVIAGLLACQVKTIITSRRFVKKAELSPLIDSLNEHHVVYLEDLRKQLTWLDKSVIAVKRSFPKWTAAKQSPQDEAVILFTSGTEGLPKGVVHSHDSLLANVTQIRTLFDFSSQDKLMVCLPTFHVLGLLGLTASVAIGIPVFLYPTPLHYRTVPERVYEHRCTVLFSTSTFLGGYARFAEPYDFHSLRYVVAGAEKLSPEVVKTYHEKYGIRILEGYGSTEMAPLVSVNTPISNRLGSVGKIAPGIDFDIEPVSGIESGGKLILRADNVMLGYLRADNPGVLEPAPIVNQQRQYDTGDIVEIDDDGFVHIQGRVKRFAKLAGEMVSLDAVEEMAEHAAPTFHHAVVATADKRKGEQIILFTTDEHLTVKALQQSAKTMGLPKLAVPRTIHVVEAIPVFASGKTNYRELNDKL